MKRLMLSLLFVVGCEVVGQKPPEQGECSEFDYHTKRGSKSITCRVLWCGYGMNQTRVGGPSVLWCEESK